MKKVFSSNDMVAHVWASRSQDEGRTGKGKFYFRYATIYSYGSHFPIAKFDETSKGETAVLFTIASYSTSTRRHMRIVSRAIPSEYPVFHVKYIYRDVRMEYDPITNEAIGRDRDYKNMEDYQERVDELLLKASRAREHAAWLWERAKELAEEANAYAEAFGLKARIDMATLEARGAELKAKARKVSVEKAKKTKERAEYQKGRYADDKAEYIEKMEQWKAGEDVYFPTMYAKKYWPYKPDENELYNLGLPVLRLSKDGKRVQTSLGAEVPTRVCARLWKLVQGKLSGEIQTMVYGMPKEDREVGHFTLNEIYPNGNIKVGCHTIPYAELERMAKILGLAE